MVKKPLQELTDLALIQQYKQVNDRDALNELLQRNYHLIYGACYKVLGDQEDAKDVCLDVCESLITKLKQDDIVYFSSWLYTVCHNRSVSYIRQRDTRRKRETSIEKNAETFVENQGFKRLTNESSPQMTMDRAKDRLGEFMTELPYAQRRCLQLFYFKQMSYSQIADETKSGIAQVKSHLQSGKRKLKLLYQAANERIIDP